MKRNFTLVIICAAGMLLAGVMAGISASTPSQEAIPFKLQTNTVPGVGFIYGAVRYTNTAASISIQPSNNVTSFTFSDISGIQPPYVSYAIGEDITIPTQYPTNNFTNTTTFPVNPSHHYELTVYVMSNPPTNGTPILTSLLQNTN